MNSECLFKEEQKFTQWWVWLLLLFVMGLFIYGLLQQLILKVPFGNNPASDAGLVFFNLLVLSVCVFFWSLKLKTTITQKKLIIRYFPLFNKHILWKNVQKAEIIKYGFIGGYGIRISMKYGTVYNVKGNKGLAITLKNGKKYLIGTQRENELGEIIRSINKVSVT